MSAVRTATVVLPAYNEAGIIASSLARVADVLLSTLGDRHWEIVVVDDGSSDGTGARAAEAGAALTSPMLDVRVVQHPSNRGLGGALQTAFTASTGDVVVVVDSDLSYHPDHIPRLVHALERAGAQVAIASPYMPEGQTIGVPPNIERRSRAANAFLSAAVHGEITTLTGMVRAYDGAFIRALALKAMDVDINIEIIYKAKILRSCVVEIPATLDWRGLELRADRSRLANRRTRSKVYNTIVDGVLFRPYVIFAASGLGLLGVGAVLAVLALLLPGSQFGLTVSAVSATATGLLLCFACLLSVQIKRCFEELFFLGSRQLPDPMKFAGPAAEDPAPQPGADPPRQPAGRHR